MPSRIDRLATLEALATRRPGPVRAELPTDPAELRRLYDAMVAGPRDPVLAGLSAQELVDRYQRQISRGHASLR